MGERRRPMRRCPRRDGASTGHRNDDDVRPEDDDDVAPPSRAAAFAQPRVDANASVRVGTRVDGGLTGAATAAGAGIVLLIRMRPFAPECVAPWRMMATFFCPDGVRRTPYGDFKLDELLNAAIAQRDLIVDTRT